MNRSPAKNPEPRPTVEELETRRCELERLDAALGQVLLEQREIWEQMASLSHKINNPLTSLIGRAQLLKQRQGNDEYVRHAAEVIEESSKRVADYLRELTGLVKTCQEEVVRLTREAEATN
jgi:signal transduction histidine kinase